MKLELRHLAPYLPYGFKIFVDSDGFLQNDETFEVNAITQNGVNVSTKRFPFNTDYSFDEFKIILRPLSDLTKEIEINGEQLMPLEKLGQEFIQDGFYEDGVFGWGQSTGGGDEQDYSLTIVKENGNLNFNIWYGNEFENGYVVQETPLNYYYTTKLLEMHFDIFNLIKNNLARDINTINQ